MTESDVIAAITVKTKTFCDFQNSGNVKALIGLYTNDCKLLAPGEDLLVGAEGVQRLWDDCLKSGQTSVTIKVEEIGSLGQDAVFCRKSYTIGKADGSQVHGKGLAIWKKLDGDYRIYSDCWNAN